jgi:hypothetical protein
MNLLCFDFSFERMENVKDGFSIACIFLRFLGDQAEELGIE